MNFSSPWFRIGLNLVWLVLLFFPFGKIIHDQDRARRVRQRLLIVFLIPYLIADCLRN